MSESLNYVQADEFIRAFEAESDLLRYQVDGWCVWPLLRMSASLMLQDEPVPGVSRLGRWQRLWLGLRGLPCLAFLPRKRWLISTYSTARAEKINGRFVDVFFDELLAGRSDYFKVETINNTRFHESERDYLVKSQMYMDTISMIVGTVRMLHKPSEVAQTAAELAAALRREPRFAELTPAHVGKVLLWFYCSKQVWSWMLRRIQPKCVLRADYAEYPLTAGAKELGIEVIEFQHGVIDRFHPGYSWSSYALSYKPKMPIPDRLLLYGPYFQEQLAASGFWGDALRPVGSLRIDRYRQLKPAGLMREGIPALLVTTQGLDRERLIAFLLQFLEHCKNRLELRVCIKLHPVYDPDKAPYIRAFGGHKNVNVLLGNEQPSTFELLCEARWHASIYSSCHYDALGLGVPTIILPLALHESVKNLADEGFALLARSPQELRDSLLEQRPDACRQDASSHFYTPGALNNIRRELRLVEECSVRGEAHS